MWIFCIYYVIKNHLLKTKKFMEIYGYLFLESWMSIPRLRDEIKKNE